MTVDLHTNPRVRAKLTVHRKRILMQVAEGLRTGQWPYVENPDMDVDGPVPEIVVFNMNFEAIDIPGCGTVRCIRGLAEMFDANFWNGASSKEFRILDRLCYPSGGVSYSEITPEVAARAIDLAVADRIPDYNKLMMEKAI